MSPLVATLLETWRRPGLLLAVLAATAIWIAAFFLWLGLPIATGWQVFLQAAAALGLLLYPCFLVARVFRALGGTRVRFSSALVAGILLAGLAGLALPYVLIWWIPKLQSLAGQSASAAVRFLLAGLLFSNSLIWVIRLAAEPHGQDLPPQQRETDSPGAR